MESTTNRTIVKFLSRQGGLIRLGFPRARMDITAEEVRQVMGEMLNSGIILTANGSPYTKQGAHILTTTRNNLV